MKIQMEFNLPEEQEDYEIFINARDMYCSLLDIQNYIRKTLKHTDISLEVEQHLECIRNLLPGLE